LKALYTCTEVSNDFEILLKAGKLLQNRNWSVIGQVYKNYT